MTKTFLVTGATGFIGQVLVKVLLQKGHTVYGFTRNVERASKLGLADVIWFSDLATYVPKHKIDVVINLAGESIFGLRWTKSKKQAIWQSRVDLTQKLIGFVKPTRSSLSNGSTPRPWVIIPTTPQKCMTKLVSKAKVLLQRSWRPGRRL